MHFSKTRIAPTPSGYLHLGNAYSFVLTAQLAKRYGARILLRLDDLDRGRVNKDYVQDVFDTLDFLNIDYHEGPHNLLEYENEWSQVHRINIYQTYLDQLRDEKLVYTCVCSRTQITDCTCRDKNLPLDTPEANWRLMTADKSVTIKTLNAGLVTATLPEDMHDFVVRKKDGYPAYQLASLVDDLYFSIDLIVRGQDLWASTIAQCYLAQVLGKTDFQNITFHHHPLLMESGDKKLSKSAGATSIKYLREHGKTVADIFAQIEKLTKF